MQLVIGAVIFAGGTFFGAVLVMIGEERERRK